MTSRRRFLSLVGGGTVLAAGGYGAFLATREPSRALAPWNTAGTGYDDPRLHALSYALLAPNPHNRQPWQVALTGEDGFTLYAQGDRKLPQTDPKDRQITIGLGCFMELARQAAAQRGLHLQTDLFPEGEPDRTLDDRPVLHARLVDGAKPDRLFEAVHLRRSCKEPFDLARPVSREILDALGQVVTPQVAYGATSAPGEVKRIRELGWQGHEVEVHTPHTLLESVELMRLGKTEIEANPDGLDLGGPFLETLQIAGLMDHEQLADPTSEAFRQGIVMYQEMFENTPAFLWLSTRGNSRVEQLAAGASWVRVNLAATRAGLALHPVSQTLQEYPEMANLYARMHETLGATGRRVQMLGRIGFGPEVAPSPRWPLETRLVRSGSTTPNA